MDSHKLQGLTDMEAATRLALDGPNALHEAPPEPLWRGFLRQFRSPLIYILLVALAVDSLVWVLEGATGLPLESAVIAGILAINAFLGLWQERRAERAVARLRQLAAPQVWTLRDGHLRRVPSAELVVGDVVRLEAGDRIPADGAVVAGDGLLADESVLTGESVAVDKASRDEVSSGTLLVRGSGYMEVTRTGPRSAMGRLAALLEQVKPEPTPLERRLQAFGHVVARVILVLVALLMAGGLAIEGIERFPQVFLLAVALAVAAVPEGLPAVLALTLALGVERMARRHAVVRRLASVESLGSVTVIATDKTGTITENRMQVRVLDVADRDLGLIAIVVANEAEPNSPVGDPMELGLLEFARQQGIDVGTVRSERPRHSSRPFDSAWKFMRVTVEENGGLVSYCKGAPEEVLRRSALEEAERQAWAKKVRDYAAEGYRALGLACGQGEAEDGWSFLGLALLWDPPRPEVTSAIQASQSAGIRVLMITGDHPVTAQAIANQVGIPASRIAVGEDLKRMPSEGVAALVAETNVFARVLPEDKLTLVEGLKSRGQVVAMTGDGVNDAPALKRADVGVAMGQRGSDVAREVADLVLQDDNFATIVAAVEEGRSIFENIQKFIRYLFAGNLAEVLVVVVGLAIALALGLRSVEGELLLPLTAVQLLWINLITDAAPALALALDRNPGTMQRPPRNPRTPLLDRASLGYILVAGGSLAMVTLATLSLSIQWGLDSEQARTLAFLTLIIGHLTFPLSARHLGGSPPRNPVLILAITVSMGLQFLALFTPQLRTALQLVPIPAWAIGWAVSGGIIAWVVSEAAARAWTNGKKERL